MSKPENVIPNLAEITGYTFTESSDCFDGSHRIEVYYDDSDQWEPFDIIFFNPEEAYKYIEFLSSWISEKKENYIELRGSEPIMKNKAVDLSNLMPTTEQAAKSTASVINEEVGGEPEKRPIYEDARSLSCKYKDAYLNGNWESLNFPGKPDSENIRRYIDERREEYIKTSNEIGSSVQSCGHAFEVLTNTEVKEMSKRQGEAFDDINREIKDEIYKDIGRWVIENATDSHILPDQFSLIFRLSEIEKPSDIVSSVFADKYHVSFDQGIHG